MREWKEQGFSFGDYKRDKAEQNTTKDDLDSQLPNVKIYKQREEAMRLQEKLRQGLRQKLDKQMDE